jgi:hypothetical protein
LTAWSLNGGARGGDGFRLQAHEYDGFITLQEGEDSVRLPWHVLLHKAANVNPSTTTLDLQGSASSTLSFSNPGGATPGGSTIFSLTGTSARYGRSALPKPGDNIAIVDLRAVGVRYIPNGAGAGLDVIQFGVTTWGERTHPTYPAEFDVFIDVNSDGEDDYLVYSAENGTFGSSGQNITVLRDLATGAEVARFLTTTDFDSANATLSILRNDIGLSPTTPFRFSVVTGDNYFTGIITDAIVDMTHTLGVPRFVPSVTSVTVPVNGAADVTVTHNPAGAAASPSQTGLLVLYADARKGREADVVTVVP